jgi:tyrosyl-tRNA synthetase
MTDTNPQKIKEALTRGVENVYPNREELEKALMSGKKLRIYNGIDPTGKLHIGHLAVLNKMRQFQDLGHEVIVLIGDFTATIGDPTGKAETRKVLTRKQVLANAKSYKRQIEKILNKKSKIRFLYNEKWTNKLKPADLLTIARNFTVARLLERDMFQKRIKDGGDITVQEFMYPILQAYDSVTMDVDMEIGGNDQTFNMLAGRTLMKKMKNKEKFVLATKLLVDALGKKMGKTEGNMVNLDEGPNEMFGKIMSWPDGLIINCFELCTRVPMDKIEEIKKIPNPRDQKVILAKELVAMFHGLKPAELAEEEFNKVHRNKELPEDMLIFYIPGGSQVKEYFSLDLLCDAKLASSKNEAKRLIEAGAVSVIFNSQDKKLTNWRESIKIENGMVIKVGNRKFAKINFK